VGDGVRKNYRQNGSGQTSGVDDGERMGNREHWKGKKTKKKKEGKEGGEGEQPTEAKLGSWAVKTT